MRALFLSTVVLLGACLRTPRTEPADAGRSSVDYGALLRVDFNRRAQELFFPLFWSEDQNRDKVLQPDELAVLWGPQGARFSDYVGPQGFTPKFDQAFTAMASLPREGGEPADEEARRALVMMELAKSQPALLFSDFSAASVEDRAVVEHLLDAAARIEVLYALQKGSRALAEQLPADHPASHALFFRNQGPWCVAATTEDARCSALPGPSPKRAFGLYPAALQEDPKFCERLAREKNGAELSGAHFAMVAEDGKGFRSVPYTEAWKSEMEEVARALEAAANATSSPGEAGFKAYLLAAAAAFRTNDWESADEAWVAMGTSPSKWYLRVAPDEAYFEPCAWKAGFALRLGRINPASLEWKQKLEPVKADLEKALAALAGPPYRARAVQFQLPDFVDVVLNAGDDRRPFGSTIGQSLPNWGRVAERGGRTVAMTNLYASVDRQKALRSQMDSLFCPDTYRRLAKDAQPSLLSTILHEAAHNLGPSHEYRVKGKTDDEAFSGPLAAVMEELKSETAAYYFVDWLADRKVITQEEADQTHVRDLAWAFEKIAEGLHDAQGRPKAHSQVAAIQLGQFLAGKSVAWKADALAANGEDQGCFEVDLGQGWRPPLEALAKRVLRAKSRADRKDAERLRAQFVEAKGELAKLHAIIAERWQRVPSASYVYSVRR